MAGFEIINKAREILELPARATRDEISQAYRALSRRYHPDRCDDGDKSAGAEKFRAITWARDILLRYVDSYRYVFSEEEYNHHLRPEQINHFDHYYSIYGEFLKEPSKKAVPKSHIQVNRKGGQE